MSSPIFSVAVEGFVVTPKMQKKAGINTVSDDKTNDVLPEGLTPKCAAVIPIKVKKENIPHKATTRL